MPETEYAYCGECGSKMAADARFCPNCGTRQEPLAGAAPADPAPRAAWSPEPPPPPPAPPPPAQGPQARPAPPHGWPSAAGQRVETALPGAGELAGELALRLSTPGVRAGLIAGAITFAVCAIAGFIIAVASPDASLIGALGSEDGIFTEGLRAAVGLTQASAEIGGEDGSVSGSIMPLLFALIPLGAAFFAARALAPSLAGLREREAVLWTALGCAVVFALGVLVIALVANGQGDTPLDFEAGSVLLASLILGGAGAAAGAVSGGRRNVPDRSREQLSPVAGLVGRVLAAPVRALASLLIVATVVGVAHSEVAVISGNRPLPGESTVTAVVEEVVFGLNRGVTAGGLGVLSEFRNGALPLPNGEEHQRRFAENLDAEQQGRIFAYSGALPVYWFLPLMLVLIGAAILTALYGGFAAARRASAPTQAIAVGYGAVTGIVWALLFMILRAAGHFILEGMGGSGLIGDSLFASVLLVGTVGGAIGGLLAYRPPVPEAAAPASSAVAAMHI